MKQLTHEARTEEAVFSKTIFLMPFMPSGIKVMMYISPSLRVAIKRSSLMNTALEQSMDKGAGLWRRSEKDVDSSV